MQLVGDPGRSVAASVLGVDGADLGNEFFVVLSTDSASRLAGQLLVVALPTLHR